MQAKVFFTYLGSRKLENNSLFEPDKYKKFVEKVGFQCTYKIDKVTELLEAVIEQKDNLLKYFCHASHIILVSSTPRSKSKINAELLVKTILNLNVSRIKLINLREACTGFENALFLAQSILRENSGNRIIVVTIDEYSKLYQESDTKVRSLFSDSLTMTQVINQQKLTIDKEPNIVGSIIDRVIYLDESQHDLLFVDNNNELQMQGQGLLAATITHAPRVISELMKKNGIKINQVVDLLLHQASKLICESVSNSVGFKKEVFFLQNIGNCVSGSIPFVLESKKIEKGYLITSTFGMGFKTIASLWKIDD